MQYSPFKYFKLNFLGVSPLSFTKGLRFSLIEGSLIKKNSKNKKWVVMKDTYIAYFDMERNYYLENLLLCDQGFKMKILNHDKENMLLIENLQHSVSFNFINEKQLEEWQSQLAKIMRNPFSETQRYNSYAPIRKNQQCKWYLNASNYMKDVLNAILAAQEEIFISARWLSPELYLKRPVSSNVLNCRLDHALQMKAVIFLRNKVVSFQIFLIVISFRMKVLKFMCYCIKK